MPNSRQTAAAKIGEKADGGMPHGRRLAQQAGHHHAVHQGDARRARPSAASSSARAFSNCGCGSSHTPITVASALAAPKPAPVGVWPSTRRVSVQANRLVRRTDHESSSRPAVKRLARGGAAQHDHLAGEQRRRRARPRPRCGASAARPRTRWSPAAAIPGPPPRRRAPRHRWRNGRRPWRPGRSSRPPGWWRRPRPPARPRSPF